jgi:hypothetical protein
MHCDDKAYQCFDDFGMQLDAYVQDHDVMLERRGDNTSITNSPTKCSTNCLSRSTVQVVVVSSAALVTLLVASASAPASLRLSCKYCHGLRTGNYVIPKHVTRAISSKLSFSDVVVHLVPGGKQQNWCLVHVPTPIPSSAPTSSPAATTTMLTTSPAAPSRILFEEMIVVHQVMLKPDSPSLVDKGQESLILNFEHVSIPVKPPWSVVRLEDDSFPNECASHNT